MFHNSLAILFTLGVASGASLGAALMVYAGLHFSFLGINSLTLGAFIGALLTICLVYNLSRLRYHFSTQTLLLTGVAISFFFSSLILLTQSLSEVNEAFQIMRWLMGNLAAADVPALLTLSAVLIITTSIFIKLAPELNLLMAGDDIAISRGVAVKQVRYLLFLTTSLCVGAIVAACGPIGFVGMMVPHMCRLFVGTDHRVLIPASLLFGGSLLIFCDALTRLLFAPAELPVGIITTLLGGPFFLWLLLRDQRLNT
jgi:iron complex transport system permease protein